MDESEVERELTEAQEEFTRLTTRVRLRRQAAVMSARRAGWSKYRIAATLGVKGSTVDSIIASAEKEGLDG